MTEVPEFTDWKGTVWRLRITTGDLEPLRNTAKLDITDFQTSVDAATKLYTEPEMLVRALFLLCEDQIKEAELTPKDFAKRFDGATRVAATKALIMATVDFFHPSAEVRAKLLTVMNGTTAHSPSKGSSKSAGRRRGSRAASTPDRTPSEN